MRSNQTVRRLMLILIAGLCAWPSLLLAQLCDSLPEGGTLSGVVNTYYPGSGTVNAGATSITLNTTAIRGNTARIAVGDMLLVIQMQDADISFTNSNVYGDNVASDPANGQTALNSSGYFEYVIAQSAVSGGAVTITGAGTGGGLLHLYRTAAESSTNGQRRFQVVRVPKYRSATLSSSLAALPWDGSTGGILAIDVSGTLTLGGSVSVDGMGFRGGGGRQLTGDERQLDTDFRSRASRNVHASKGEGIAGTPLYVFNGSSVSNPGTRTYGYPSGSNNQDGSQARGAPGNAGGGGTDGNPAANNENSGGGGGGNGGIGGRGGLTWTSALDRGGNQGAVFPYAIGTNARIAMGSGGGAGSRNNSDTIQYAGSGGLGGGIVLIRAYTVTGTGTITANGNGHGIAAITPENDGSGGGGAGGTIVVVAMTGSLSGLTVQAAGGGGVDNWTAQTPGTYPGNRHGPGGGGGGGVVLLFGTPASVSVAGGARGGTTNILDAYGATAGANGVSLTNVTITDIPGVEPCSPPNVPTWARLGGLRVDPDGAVEFAVTSQLGTRGFRVYETWDPDGLGERTLLSETPIAAQPASRVGPVIYRGTILPVEAPFVLIEEMECGGATHWLGPFPVGNPTLEDQLNRLAQRQLERAKVGPADQTPTAVPIAAAGPVRALKLEVPGAGTVRVPLADLVAAGMPASYASQPGKLKLTRQGRPVTFRVVRGAGGALCLEFTAFGLSTDYALRDVYVVGWGSFQAPLPTVLLTKSGVPARPDWVRVEQNLFFAPFVAPAADPWVWTFLSTWFPPDPLAFDLPYLGLPTAGNVPVRIALSGGTAHTHTVEAWLNGARVGAATFSGLSAAEIQGAVPAGVLRQSGNVLTWAYSADVSGPDDGALAFVDLIDLGFRPDPPAAETAVARIAPYDSNLPSNVTRAGYLVVTHALFAGAAQQIADAKSAEYRTAVLDLERAYDRYSGGVVEPNAVAALLAEAWQKSRQALRYVLLVGDDTYDPHDYSATGQAAFLPSLWGWDDFFGRVPSENRFADTNGDGAPELAVGRLPVVTPADAGVVADKIVRQTELLDTPSGTPLPLLAVDDPSPEDTVSFYQLAAEAAGHIPGGADALWANVAGGVGPARASLLEGLRNSAAAVHYFGHGSYEFWTDNGLLTLADLAGLAHAGHAAAVFAWTCQAQWYQYGNEPTINEALLLVPDGGAVACLGPAGITEPELQRVFYLEVDDNLQAGLPLGEAVRRAKAAALRAGGDMAGVVAGWNLLGDPALRLYQSNSGGR